MDLLVRIDFRPEISGVGYLKHDICIVFRSNS